MNKTVEEIKSIIELADYNGSKIMSELINQYSSDQEDALIEFLQTALTHSLVFIENFDSDTRQYRSTAMILTMLRMQINSWSPNTTLSILQVLYRHFGDPNLPFHFFELLDCLLWKISEYPIISAKPEICGKDIVNTVMNHILETPWQSSSILNYTIYFKRLKV